MKRPCSWRWSFSCEKNPEAFEKFEAAFPKKEKLKLLGQLRAADDLRDGALAGLRHGEQR